MYIMSASISPEKGEVSLGTGSQKGFEEMETLMDE